MLVIQGNDQVLTHLDKAIGIKCNYDLDSITGEAVLFIKWVLAFDYKLIFTIFIIPKLIEIHFLVNFH